ncbi:hypothetical protein ELH02_14100 [Rhizobium ruizarguesonis]|uniref:hypothetical protein n=1 Tax=Rhizobium ruizarguesonis TaxID=2081791 RepID=UPI00102FFAFA|nr:hypothetical protein [Rhizobium ruizarguesonis]TBE45422.1 hypothetical protein ELH02_14100 [Rhizobium ruizarguesonis]
MANKFWAEANWPIDFGSYRFLGRAVHDMGRALFGHEWTENEPTSEFTGTFKRTPPFTRDDQWANWRLVERLVPNHFTDPIRRATRINRPPIPSSEVWTMASIELERRNAPRLRYETVRNELLKLFQSGKIQTATRRHEGGEISKIARWHWNSEDLIYRFECGKMDPHNPFAPVEDYTSPSLDWIFVDAEDLRSNLPSIFAAAAKPRGPYQSDILRFVISFNDEHSGFVRSSNKKDVQNRLFEEWRVRYPGVTLPPETEKAMAVVLRDLEKQKGRGAKAAA